MKNIKQVTLSFFSGLLLTTSLVASSFLEEQDASLEHTVAARAPAKIIKLNNLTPQQGTAYSLNEGGFNEDFPQSRAGYANTVGDTNGDGFSDLAVSNLGYRNIYVLFDPQNFASTTSESVTKIDEIISNPKLEAGARITLAGNPSIKEIYKNLGQYIGPAGDLNGDGLADMIITNELYLQEDKKSPDNPLLIKAIGLTANIVYGKRKRASEKYKIQLNNKAKGTVNLEYSDASDNYFSQIKAIGDFNGDAIDDLAVSGGFLGEIKLGPSGPVFTGREGAEYVFIIYGNNKEWPLNYDLKNMQPKQGITIKNVDAITPYFTSLNPINPTPTGHLTSTPGFLPISSLGDVNGDKLNDVGIGYPMVVIYGTKNGTNFGLGPFSKLEKKRGIKLPWAKGALTLVGDVDKDGLNDFIYSPIIDLVMLGNGEATSPVYLIYGQTKTNLLPENLNFKTFPSKMGVEITTKVVDDAFGYAVSYAGDFNGDGIDDFAIGAPGADRIGQLPNTRGGKIYVIYGQNKKFTKTIDLSQLTSEQGVIFQGEQTFVGAGTKINYAGDMNGDKRGDLVIGAGFTEDKNVTYVLYGQAGKIKNPSPAPGVLGPIEFKSASIDGESEDSTSDASSAHSSSWFSPKGWFSTLRSFWQAEPTVTQLTNPHVQSLMELKTTVQELKDNAHQVSNLWYEHGLEDLLSDIGEDLAHADKVSQNKVNTYSKRMEELEAIEGESLYSTLLSHFEDQEDPTQKDTISTRVSGFLQEAGVRPASSLHERYISSATTVGLMTGVNPQLGTGVTPLYLGK